jgi:hypothetical protein
MALLVGCLTLTESQLSYFYCVTDRPAPLMSWAEFENLASRECVYRASPPCCQQGFCKVSILFFGTRLRAALLP